MIILKNYPVINSSLYGKILCFVHLRPPLIGYGKLLKNGVLAVVPPELTRIELLLALLLLFCNNFCCSVFIFSFDATEYFKKPLNASTT